MRAKHLFAAAVFITAFATGPTPASAAPARGKHGKAASSAPAAPTAAAKEQARASYGRGQAAFSAGQYEDAKRAFDEAFAAVPNPIVLLSIAEAQVKLDQVEDGIATLQHYLELRADAPDRADIEGKIKTLSATPAHLIITSEPAGAAIDLDGLPTQKKTPTQLELAPGEHSIDYARKGYESGTETLVVKPGARPELHLTLKPAPESPAVAAAPSELAPSEASASNADIEGPAEPASSGPSSTALWITGGVGVAGLVAGSVFGMLAVKEHSNFNDHPSEASANKGERLALFADVGFGVAVMAAATCVVLYLTADDAPATDTASAHLEVIPALSPTSASATARLRF